MVRSSYCPPPCSRGAGRTAPKKRKADASPEATEGEDDEEDVADEAEDEEMEDAIDLAADDDDDDDEDDDVPLVEKLHKGQRSLDAQKLELSRT